MLMLSLTLTAEGGSQLAGRGRQPPSENLPLVHVIAVH